jgi:hypothetical protein
MPVNALIGSVVIGGSGGGAPPAPPSIEDGMPGAGRL